MRQFRPRTRRRYRLSATILVSALIAVAELLPLTVGSADSAAAAPAAGYTASLIPTGQQANSVAVNPAKNTVYLADKTDELTVVDGSTNATSRTITLPAAPREVAVDSVTDTVYVSLAQTSKAPPAVAVIDGATNTVTTTVPLPTGSSPEGIGVDSSTDTVYVAEEGAHAVAVIDGSNNSVATTVSTGSGTSPIGVAVDETTDVVWVSAIGTVLAIGGASNTVEPQIISFNGGVGVLAVNPASDTVYASVDNGPAGTVAVINGASGSVTTTISLSLFAAGLAVDPGSGTVFATTMDGIGGSGTTFVIDPSSNAIVDTVERGGREIAVNSATGSAYVAAFSATPAEAWVLTPAAANAMSPVITSTAGTLTVNTAGSFAIQGTALPTATYKESGPLPDGVTLSPSGVLSGTPAAGTGGAYPITVTASNGVTPDFSRAFTLTIDELATVAAPSTTTFQVGTLVSVPLHFTPGYPPAPVIGAQNLPPGLEVTQGGPTGWQLTGTPQSGGVYDVKFYATNDAGISYTPVTITILQPPVITTGNLAYFVAGTDNAYPVAAACFPACTITATGNLPAGVQLVSTGPSAGVIEGDPPATAAGTYNFTITATNAEATATQGFTLIVIAPEAAVGIEGGNGQLYVRAPQLASGWQPLGGQIVGPPAVAAPPNPDGTTPASPVFFATGSDGELWMRSLTAGWQPVGPSGAFCIGSPAALAAASFGTLTVACEGLNHALYYNTATLPLSGLPSFTSPWTSLGGILSAGPAVAPVGATGTVTFFVRGANGQIFTTTTASAGYTATPWLCNGAPAAATQAATGTTTFACQGGDHSLWTATNTGTGWSSAVSVGGVLAGSPGIAAATGVTELFAEGTDGTIWQWTADSGWTSLGGIGTGGTGAVALN